MLFKALGSWSLLAFTVASSPEAGVAKRADDTTPTEMETLQMASFVANFVDAAFQYGLDTFTAEQFEAGGLFAPKGLPDWVRGRVSQISEHDKSHAALYQSILGDQAPQPCTYNFDCFKIDPSVYMSFLCGVSQFSASFHINALQHISSTNVTKVVTSVLSTEARHQAWIYSAIFSGPPWTGPYDTILSFTDMYSIITAAATSCPDSNPELPAHVIPGIMINGFPIGYNGDIGDNIAVSWNGSSQADGDLYASFTNGLATTYVPLVDGNVTIPDGLQGWSFMSVTKQNSGDDTPNGKVAGGAFIHVNFDSKASNPGFQNPFGV